MNISNYDLDSIHLLLAERKKKFTSPSYSSTGTNTPSQNKAFNQIINTYQTGRLLEKSGEVIQALSYYLYILLNYVPLGSTYYERPAILLEKLKKYEAALTVCELLELTMQWQRNIEHECYTKEFAPRIARLKKKMVV